jgi:hypothetical protein
MQPWPVTGSAPQDRREKVQMRMARLMGLRFPLQAVLWFGLSAASASAADLLQVYEQAIRNDPLLKSALEDNLGQREAVRQAAAGLLPSVDVSAAFTGGHQRDRARGGVVAVRDYPRAGAGGTPGRVRVRLAFESGGAGRSAGPVRGAQGPGPGALRGVVNSLSLRQAAGILREEDLSMLNRWQR